MGGNLRQVWKHRKQILEGLTNAVFKKEYIEKIAKERMDICLKCKLVDQTGDKCFVPGTQPCCSVCGCKLYLKTRSLSSECEHPEGPLWEAILEQHEEDKLYNEINFNPDNE